MKADGSYYFHIKVGDKAGNWSDTGHVGPFVIDSTPPAITEVTVEGRPNQVGAQITIILKGEKGGKARFSLGDVVEDVEMEEKPDGEYIGTYTIVPDVVKQKVKLTVILSDVAGNEAKDESEEIFLLSVDAAGKLLIKWGSLKTMLYQNYPNPFNPETWIPYQLASDMVVQILIYDMKGIVVHRLDLGQQPAGYYISPERAAYWDGKNESGELVSSGMYFYQLKAEDFTSVKRLVILK